jgi:hypothetical protein
MTLSYRGTFADFATATVLHLLPIVSTWKSAQNEIVTWQKEDLCNGNNIIASGK